MAYTNHWSIDIDGVNYQIEFKRDIWVGKHKLLVNGQPVALPRTMFKEMFVGIDIPIMLGSKECRFVYIGNKADIVVDGMYVNSKMPYKSQKSIPWWTWLMVAACVAIPIVSLGGAFPALIALLGAVYCVRIAVSPYMETPIKILCCLGIVAVAWGAYAAVDMLLSNTLLV